MTNPRILPSRIELAQEQRRKLAHDRLDRLLDDAQVSALYGRVGVEVIVEAGRVIAIRRKLEATDK